MGACVCGAKAHNTQVSSVFGVNWHVMCVFPHHNSTLTGLLALVVELEVLSSQKKRTHTHIMCVCVCRHHSDIGVVMGQENIPSENPLRSKPLLL